MADCNGFRDPQEKEREEEDSKKSVTPSSNQNGPEIRGGRASRSRPLPPPARPNARPDPNQRQPVPQVSTSSRLAAPQNVFSVNIDARGTGVDKRYVKGSQVQASTRRIQEAESSSRQVQALRAEKERRYPATARDQTLEYSELIDFTSTPESGGNKRQRTGDANGSPRPADLGAARRQAWSRMAASNNPGANTSGEHLQPRSSSSQGHHYQNGDRRHTLGKPQQRSTIPAMHFSANHHGQIPQSADSSFHDPGRQNDGPRHTLESQQQRNSLARVGAPADAHAHAVPSSKSFHQYLGTQDSSVYPMAGQQQQRALSGSYTTTDGFDHSAQTSSSFVQNRGGQEVNPSVRLDSQAQRGAKRDINGRVVPLNKPVYQPPSGQRYRTNLMLGDQPQSDPRMNSRTNHTFEARSNSTGAQSGGAAHIESPNPNFMAQSTVSYSEVTLTGFSCQNVELGSQGYGYHNGVIPDGDRLPLTAQVPNFADSTSNGALARSSPSTAMNFSQSVRRRGYPEAGSHQERLLFGRGLEFQSTTATPNPDVPNSGLATSSHPPERAGGIDAESDIRNPVAWAENANRAQSATRYPQIALYPPSRQRPASVATHNGSDAVPGSCRVVSRITTQSGLGVTGTGAEKANENALGRGASPGIPSSASSIFERSVEPQPQVRAPEMSMGQNMNGTFSMFPNAGVSTQASVNSEMPIENGAYADMLSLMTSDEIAALMDEQEAQEKLSAVESQRWEQ